MTSDGGMERNLCGDRHAQMGVPELILAWRQLGSYLRAAVVSAHARPAVHCVRCTAPLALGKDRTFDVAAHNSGSERNLYLPAE